MNRMEVVKGGAEHETCAYVTFLMGSGDYVKGVVALAKSLRAVHSRYPLVVAVTSDVPWEHRALLEAQNCLCREVEVVSAPAGSEKLKFAVDYYAKNYTKLRIWEFDDFGRMVYLDADMLVLKNVDELFGEPRGAFCAVMDCFCEPSWAGSVQHNLGYCQQCPERVPWTQPTPSPQKYFNAGMFVFEPSRAVFLDMMNQLVSNPPTPFAEQDFLNTYFRETFRPIPTKYNLVLAMLWRHRENVDLPSMKIIHYCAKGSKPWAFAPAAEHMDVPEVKQLVDAWWNVYLSPAQPTLKTDFAASEIGAPFSLTGPGSVSSAHHCKLLGLQPSKQGQQPLMKAGTAA